MNRNKITIHLNKEACKKLYGKAEADDMFQGAKIALKRLEIQESLIYNTFKFMKDEERLFFMKPPYVYRLLGFDINGKCLPSIPSKGI